MKKEINFTLAVLFITITMLSCSKSNHYEDAEETNISATGSNRSHNMGQNCMNCHYGGGQGEGVFKVAGTVYNEAQTATFPNTTIKLYTGPDGTGTLKHVIYVDGKGNFYTTESIDFSAALYPAVINGANINYMGSSVSTGQCNSCHNGSSTDRIWIN